MSDDVDPTEAQTAETSPGPVDIAMVEIELVELEERQDAPAEVLAEAEPVAVAEAEPEEEAEEPGEPTEPLPTMADLDVVSSELDEIDARLASLDEQRP